MIGAAIDVHRALGPGLLERIYERCVLHELALRKLRAESQQQIQICYKDISFEETLKFDILVEGCLLVEIKAVAEVLPVHKAQAMSYMRLLNAPLGLVLNFHENTMNEGVHRLILPGAGRE